MHSAWKSRPRNDLYCVGRDVKPPSLTHSVPIVILMKTIAANNPPISQLLAVLLITNTYKPQLTSQPQEYYLAKFIIPVCIFTASNTNEYFSCPHYRGYYPYYPHPHITFSYNAHISRILPNPNTKLALGNQTKIVPWETNSLQVDSRLRLLSYI